MLAATAGGATALRRQDLGRLAPGARANALVLDAPSYSHLIYRPGVPLTKAVISEGELAWGGLEDGTGFDGR